MTRYKKSIFLSVILFCIAFNIQLTGCKSSPDDLDGKQNNTSEIVPNVSINWSDFQQTILGNGINFEGYHSNGGAEVLSQKFVSMLETLPSQLNRVCLPLNVWEPGNDNTDPFTIDFSHFNDSGGARNTFLRIKELKNRGMESWLSIWDMSDWNILNPDKTSKRKIANFDEMAESITAFLVYGKQTYNIEPLYVSVNEPTIASENGWGGYNIAYSPEEQISLIQKAGILFDKYQIKTKWLIAVHKVYPSELEQAKQIFANPDVKKYVAGFDFHSYSMQNSEFEPYLKNWYEWSKTTGLPTFCGECDYDNAFWLNPDRETWTKAALNYGTLLHRIFNTAKVNAFIPWYANNAEDARPYRFISKHFMETFKKGAVLVKSTSTDPNLLVTAGKLDEKYIVHIQNTSVYEKTIQIDNLPVNQFDWICSKNNSYYQTQPQQNVKNGIMTLKLPPSSFSTFIGK